jgi:hypothetical protein
MNTSGDNSRQVELGWLLNELIVDLKTPVDVMFLLKGGLNNNEIMSLSRLCISSIIINLCRLNEILSHYGKEITAFPNDLKTELRQIQKEVESKKMYTYRSKYIAHAFSEEKGESKRPLPFADAVKALMVIIDRGLNPVSENAFAFCEWVYQKDSPACVVNTIHSAVSLIDKNVGGLGKRC